MSSLPKTSPEPLSFMQTLNPLVSFYRPPQSPDSIPSHNPRLIIFCSWADARAIHIAKYITKYKSLYPSATILLLRSTMSCIVRPSQIGPAMRDAALFIRAAPESETAAPMLIHMFSNGGSSSVANLYEQFAATAGSSEDKRLPKHFAIFDSSPGLLHMSRSVAVVSVGMPHMQRMIATPFLYALSALWSVAVVLGLLDDSLGKWFRSHNDEVGNSNEIRRVYVNSHDDILIDYRDVERHAAEAKASGFEVELERYEGSAHVAHMRKDEGRYWGIVQRIVEG
jgi:hypothetical protein